MNAAWSVVVGIGAGLLLAWLALVIALVLASRRHGRLGLAELARLLPDLLRLLKRMATDPNLPTGVRVRLWLPLIYLAIPFDLIPDFIPVLGYADDAIIVAVGLRAAARAAGPDALARHWPGTEAGLATILRAAGIRATDP